MRTHTVRRRPATKARNSLNKMRWALFSLLILASLFAYTTTYKNATWLDFTKPATSQVLASPSATPSSALPKVSKYKPLPEVWTDDVLLSDFSPFVAGFKDADFFGEGRLVALNDQFDVARDEVYSFLQANRIQGINQLMLTDMARSQYFVMTARGDAGGNNVGSGGANAGGGNGGAGQNNKPNAPLQPLIIAENTEQTADIDSLTSAVPLPAAVWLFASALVGLFGVRRKIA